MQKQSFKSKYRKVISLIGAILMALMVVGGSHKSWCTKNINLSFKSSSVTKITYSLFYTTSVADEFDDQKVVAAQVRTGVHRVKMIIPAHKVAKIRLNINDRFGSVNISKLKLNGRNGVDLSDYSDLRFINVDDEEIVPDGSLMVSSEQDNPYIMVNRAFNVYKGYDIDFFKVGMYFGSVFLIFYAFFMLALYEKKKKKKDPYEFY
jgi:uncharacterized protein (DUF1015 family)